MVLISNAASSDVVPIAECGPASTQAYARTLCACLCTAQHSNQCHAQLPQALCTCVVSVRDQRALGKLGGASSMCFITQKGCHERIAASCSASLAPRGVNGDCGAGAAAVTATSRLVQLHIVCSETNLRLQAEPMLVLHQIHACDVTRVCVLHVWATLQAMHTSRAILLPVTVTFRSTAHFAYVTDLRTRSLQCWLHARYGSHL